MSSTAPPADAGATEEAKWEPLRRQLQAPESTERLAALDELRKIGTSTPSILQHVERMALGDPIDEVRRAARAVLENPGHRKTYQSMTALSSQERQVVLQEIRTWSDAGLVPLAQAEIIGRRYSYDAAPPPIETTAEITCGAPRASGGPNASSNAGALPPTVLDAVPSERDEHQRRPLSRRLLRHRCRPGPLRSGRIRARLPILAAVTGVFGVASLALEKRLPRPSFVLFLVFSSLLLIDAGVIAGMLRLQGAASAAYWGVVLGMTTILWAFSTRDFASRLLSLAAFVSLEFSAVSFGRLADPPDTMTLVLCSLAAVAGVLGAGALARWRGRTFAVPLFVLVQATEALVLFAGFTMALVLLATPGDSAPNEWISLAAAWGIGATILS